MASTYSGFPSPAVPASASPAYTPMMSSVDPRLRTSTVSADHEMDDPDFEEMVSDLRRGFVGWLQRMQSEIKQKRSDLKRDRQAFEDEKLSVWQQFMAEKQREVDKIRDDRRRAEEETASHLRNVQAEVEEHRRRIEEERGRLDQEGAVRRRAGAHEYEKFRQEYGLFEADKGRVVNPQLAAETTVDLNVGGTVFETSRAGRGGGAVGGGFGRFHQFSALLGRFRRFSALQPRGDLQQLRRADCIPGVPVSSRTAAGEPSYDPKAKGPRRGGDRLRWGCIDPGSPVHRRGGSAAHSARERAALPWRTCRRYIGDVSPIPGQCPPP
ncbi:unnamed protein product [Prorocentrum cordatum]|uniref:Uncharacterized protein n=1 Tax=Prorocentrum cordatum TaxID=2364126 RepID=A0ABN9W9L4_9DINO|nr:unnamed protein product [Polarella glacialis]